MTTVVLGWDALDYELLQQWGLSEAFGANVQHIETLDNPVLGTPHTQELWPTLITGLEPSEHGIWAAEPDDETVDWDSQWLQMAATVGSHIVPQRVRTQIGRWLRNQGAGIDQHQPDYYRQHGVETVFDGRRSLAISVPNYHTETDQQHGFTSDRAQLWHDIIDEKGTDGYDPSVPTDEVDRRLAGAAQKRLAHVEAAIQRDYDLVWCWLGFIDSVGHIAPSVDEQGWQRRHYHQAAQWTQRLRASLTAGDELLCVSDHGLQDGEHTHQAVFAGPEAVSDAESILDVAGIVDQIAGSGSEAATPSVRPAFAQQGGSQDDTPLTERLRTLGYID